ncbi:MAG TPA: permease-like cell division protein FtsX [Candidatus Saccharimonadia bacterium]
MVLQLWRVIHAGARNFTRNLWLSTAATAVMTITLTIVLVSFISNSALTNTIKNVTDKIDVSIYLNDNISPAQLDGLKAKIAANPDVAGLRYISKADALADWRAQHANDPQLLQATTDTDNPLPASFAIKARDPKHLDSLSALVQQPDVSPLLDAKTPFSYSGKNKTTIDRIISFSSFFRTSGLIVSVIFVTISVLIIFNTIRMAIFTRRDEIEIMKLVGATKWFVRGPFLFEAALYGIVAAIVSAGLSYALLFAGGPKVKGYIDLNAALHLFQAYPFIVIGGAVFIGVCIGMFSSLLAMGRYLKL